MLEVLSENHRLTIENTKRAIADSYYALGYKMKCLTKQANTLIKPAKIGRNVPCPCGSEKKYMSDMFS